MVVEEAPMGPLGALEGVREDRGILGSGEVGMAEEATGEEAQEATGVEMMVGR